MEPHVNAYDAVTTNNPTERDRAILFAVECLMRRFPYRRKANYPDCWYVLCLLVRWGWIKADRREDLGRKALGNMVMDIWIAWDLTLGNEPRSAEEYSK